MKLAKCSYCGLPESIQHADGIYLIESCPKGHKLGKLNINRSPLFLEKIKRDEELEAIALDEETGC